MDERPITSKSVASPKKTSLNKIPPKPATTVSKTSVLQKSGGLTVDTNVRSSYRTELSPTASSTAIRKTKSPSPVLKNKSLVTTKSASGSDLNATFPLPTGRSEKPISKNATMSVTRSPSKTPTASSTSINVQPQNDFQLTKPSPSTSAVYITEESIGVEFRAIADVLRTKTQEEWGFRNKALIRLQSLILGGLTEYSSFLRQFELIKQPLYEMVADLRSIIVKESCTVLALLAEKLKNQFEPYVTYYIPALLRQIIVKIKIIADSADQCIKSLVTETRLKNIKAITEGARSQKDIILRKRCTEYLSLIINTYDDTTLERLRDSLEVVITLNLSDAAGEVRTEARKCYWLYAAKWREDGMRLFNQLDPLVQKYLNKDSVPASPDIKRATKSVPHSPMKLLASPKKIEEIEEYALPKEAPKLLYTNPPQREAWKKGLYYCYKCLLIDKEPAKNSVVADSVELFDLAKTLHEDDLIFSEEPAHLNFDTMSIDQQLFSLSSSSNSHF